MPQKVEGVDKVEVSLAQKQALIDVMADSQADALALLPTLVTAIKNIGFEASV